MAEFKDRLKELRKERGMSQQELADLLGKTESSIRKYENGSVFPPSNSSNRIPSYTTLKRYEYGESDGNGGSLIAIAKFFNVSTDYLLGLSDIRKFEINLSQISTDELLEEIKRRCNQ